jgi:membrane-bound inhibitor of C-type lysozyme
MICEAEAKSPRSIPFALASAAGLAALMLAGQPAKADKIVNVTYACEDGTRFDAIFNNTVDTLTIGLPGGAPVVMTPAASGSGFRFVKDGYEVHGKGPNALLTRPGKQQTNCSAQ